MTTIAQPSVQRLIDRELILQFSCTDWEVSDDTQVPVFRFLMYRKGRGEPAGHINLRLVTTPTILSYQGHIGYAVRPPYRGRRFAARSCRLVLPIFREHGFSTVWATCNPENAASQATLEIAGARFVDEVDIPESYTVYAQGERSKLRYRFDL